MPDTLRVGLFYDGASDLGSRGDRLAKSESYADITTEPTDYYDGPVGVRWPEDVQTETIDAGRLILLDITAAIEYSYIDGSDGYVDAYYVSAEFQSGRMGDTSPTENLVWTGQLPEYEDSGRSWRDLSVADEQPEILEGVRHGPV